MSDTMTDLPRGFKDSLLADRLIRVFGGGGALFFAALAVGMIVGLIRALTEEGVFVWPSALLALVFAGIAAPLADVPAAPPTDPKPLMSN